MARGLGTPAYRRQHALRDGLRPACLPGGRRATFRRQRMQWQTPTAIDFRFGFEITLYVAAR